MFAITPNVKMSHESCYPGPQVIPPGSNRNELAVEILTFGIKIFNILLTKIIWHYRIIVLSLCIEINQLKHTTMVNLTKHIWEGWTVQDFINELEPTFNRIMDNGSWEKPFKTRDDVKKWCMDNQPYYKKYIKDVVDYFVQKL